MSAEVGGDAMDKFAAGDVDMQTVVGHVAEYRQLHEQIKGLEAQAEEAREAVCELLNTAGAVVGAQWKFPPIGVVKVAKGRVTEKLDRAALARAGVSAEVLDAATVRTEAKPTVRIEGWKGEEEE